MIIPPVTRRASPRPATRWVIPVASALSRVYIIRIASIRTRLHGTTRLVMDAVDPSYAPRRGIQESATQGEHVVMMSAMARRVIVEFVLRIVAGVMMIGGSADSLRLRYRL